MECSDPLHEGLVATVADFRSQLENRLVRLS